MLISKIDYKEGNNYIYGDNDYWHIYYNLNFNNRKPIFKHYACWMYIDWSVVPRDTTYI